MASLVASRPIGQRVILSDARARPDAGNGRHPKGALSPMMPSKWPDAFEDVVGFTTPRSVALDEDDELTRL